MLKKYCENNNLRQFTFKINKKIVGSDTNKCKMYQILIETLYLVSNTFFQLSRNDTVSFLSGGISDPNTCLCAGGSIPIPPK